MITNFYYNILTIKIESGNDFTLCLTSRGEVYTWSDNQYGQLDIGTTDDDYHELAKLDFMLDIPIRFISAGNGHAVAIDFDHNVYIWGHNNYGQLGLGIELINVAQK